MRCRDQGHILSAVSELTESRGAVRDDSEHNQAVEIGDLWGPPGSVSLISMWCDSGPSMTALLAVGRGLSNSNSSG